LSLSSRIIFLFLLIVFSCKQKPHAKLAIGTELGKVDKRLEEASGLVASVNNPGFLWSINDSGNDAEVFLIDSSASIRLVCTLANINNRDWEDITIDTDADGKTYLYVADIGDNFDRYENKIVYRFEEPVLSKEEEKTITQFETFIFPLPSGYFDSEAILIDPTTHDLFIISKEKGSTTLYRASHPLTTNTKLEKILSMPLSTIVAGNISADGQQVLLKSYRRIYYWKKSGNETLTELLVTEPTKLPYHREPQGESIAWSIDGTKYYTLSESLWGNRASLIEHKMDSSLTKIIPAN